MEYEFWDLKPERRSNGRTYASSNDPAELVLLLELKEDENFLEYMDKHWYKDVVPLFAKDYHIKPEKTYYIRSQDYEETYVITLHKGYSSWRKANGDEQFVIALYFGFINEEGHLLIFDYY